MRNDVIFNGRKSIVINVRDLTDQQDLYDSKAKIKHLTKTVERLTSEQIDPISIIN